MLKSVFLAVSVIVFFTSDIILLSSTNQIIENMIELGIQITLGGHHNVKSEFAYNFETCEVVSV